MPTNLTIHTDGACSGNPGPGGWAFTISPGPFEHSDGFGYELHTTNNRMELTAVYEGLSAVHYTGEVYGKVTVISDSKYVTEAFNQKWIEGWQKRGWRTSAGTPVANKDIWIQLIGIIHDLLNTNTAEAIIFQWVKGHANDPKNILVDARACEMRDTAKDEIAASKH